MKIYKHLIHRHVEFPVWGYWDKKREFIAFQPADERNSEHWNRLSVRRLFRPVFFGGEKFNWSFPIIFISRKYSRNPMVVQWIGLYTSTAEGVGSIPGWGTKILCAVGSQKKRKHMSCQLCCFLLVDSSWNPQISELLCYPCVLHELLASRPNSPPVKLGTLNGIELINKGIESCINTVQVEGQFKMETRKHLKCS